MLYTVHGTRTEIMSVKVEADSPSEAFEKAQNGEWETYLGMDVWDTDDDFYTVTTD